MSAALALRVSRSAEQRFHGVRSQPEEPFEHDHLHEHTAALLQSDLSKLRGDVVQKLRTWPFASKV